MLAGRSAGRWRWQGEQGPARNRPVPPQENSFLWNKFADGKLLFRNLKLMNAMLDRKDPMVQEFWRLLAICHTVMVQEKDSEDQRRSFHPAPGAPVTPLSQAPPLLDLEDIRSQGSSELCPRAGRARSSKL